MGREVRRVPPNWEHPRYTRENVKSREGIGEYKSCHDEDYETASLRWIRELLSWQEGKHPSQIRDRKEGFLSSCKYYWEYAGAPPDEEYCRPKFTEEPTWYQMYQTVSEGSPVSPPFATEEELATYLSEHGDFWYQLDQNKDSGYPTGSSKPTYEQALATVKSGWGPSMMTVSNQEGVKILGPYEVSKVKEN